MNKRKTLLLFGGFFGILLSLFLIKLLVDANISKKKLSEYSIAKPIVINNVFDSAAETENPQKISSYIPLSPYETLLGITAVDLNLDDSEEQLHVVRKQTDPSGHLFLLVAQYNPKTRTWSRILECETLVTQIKTLNLRIKLITGDNIMSLICEGLNDKNESTISIFRILQSQDAANKLLLQPVFSDFSDSVVLENESNENGKTASDSEVISISKNDPDNPEVILEEKWRWDNPTNKYVKYNTQFIQRAKLISSKIAGILNSPTESIFGFVSGIWIKNQNKDSLIIDFQTNENLVVFLMTDYSEIYSIDSVTSTRLGLYISCINQSISTLKRYITLEIKSDNQVELRIFQNINVKGESSVDWNGTYSRYVGNTRNKVVYEPASKETSSAINGTYKDTAAQTLIFNYPSYLIRDASNAIIEEGFACMYSVQGKSLLDLIPTNNPSRPRRTFMVSTKSVTILNIKKGLLLLQPVKISLTGILETGEASIEYERQ